MRLALPGSILCVVLAMLAAMMPEASWGGGFHRKRHCQKCSRAVDCCICPTPCLTADPCPPACPVVACPPVTHSQTTLRPIVDTQYVQRPLFRTRTVQETCVRQERFLQTVPTTVCENVTTDEGCYKMVWVPRPVTRQVPKTVYTQRLACRAVPYTVNRQVTECTTQTVPVQRLRYIPETKTVTCVTTLGCPIDPLCPPDPHCVTPFGPQPAGTLQAPPTLQPAPMPTSVPEPRGVSTQNPPASGQPTMVLPRSQGAVRPARDREMMAVAPSAASVWRTVGN